MNPYPSQLELVALGSEPDQALTVAGTTGAIAYVAHESAHPKAPFRSLLRAVVSDLDQLAPAADIAVHLAYSRQVKAHDVTWPPGQVTPGVVAAFGLKHHPDNTHEQTDQHWRDIHAPLALEHHQAMWDYVQLSIVATLAGPPLDGIALCAFPTLADHDERFFNDATSERIIGEDVARFADLRRSPRPVLLTEHLPA